jgi:hypothetical protein
MVGYLDEVLKVGVIDNDDMREYAWAQIQKFEKQAKQPKKISPNVWWAI